MGKMGFAHAWLNVGLPKVVAKKSEIVAERDELAKKVAALEAKLAGK